MSPFLHRGILKRKDPLATAAGPSIPQKPHSNTIPNTDPLPPSADALEGLLNAHSSQLQKLASRIESVNEWLEMDVIVLAKLIHDISAQVDKEEAAERAASERALALWKKNNRVSFVPAASKGPVSPAPYRRGVNNTNTKNYKYNTGQGSSGEGKNGNAEHRRVPSGESRVPEVFLKGLTLAVKSKSKEERINENCGVRDLRKRIEAMKLWRREIERTVVWQREEYRRVQKAIRRQNGHSEGNGSTGRSAARRVVQFEVEGGVEGKGKAKEGAEPVKTTGVQRYEGWGGGWQTWEKKSGRVPSQAEWEELFSDGRIG